jgi:hypothetical protein
MIALGYDGIRTINTKNISVISDSVGMIAPGYDGIRISRYPFLNKLTVCV